MKTRHYVLALSIAGSLALSGCGQKAATEDTKNTTTTTMEDSSLDMGAMTAGTIVENKTAENDACKWTIKTKDGRLFETSSMDKSFMKDGAQVMFSFRGLRRMSMCGNTTPIEIEQMKMMK